MEDYEIRRSRGLDELKALAGATDVSALANDIIANNGALGSYALDFVMSDVWGRDELSRRDRSIVVLAILGSIHQTNQLPFYIAGGLNHGLTPEEIREIFTHLALYAGFPRALDAMAVVNHALAEAGHGLGEGGLPGAEQMTDAERLASGGSVLARLSGNDGNDPEEVLASMVGRLGPIANVGIRFGFGEAWARPQLSRRDRSFVTVSVLTALGRGAELDIHIPAAIRHGVTKVELEELMFTVMAYAGAPLAVEAMQIVNRQ